MPPRSLMSLRAAMSPRSISEQLAARGNQKPSRPGRPRQPGLGAHRDAERER